MKYKNRAIFLDRDGTLITERGYLTDPRKMVFYKGIFQPLKEAINRGYKLVIITNQSGVGRGYLTLSQLHVIHLRFSKILRRHGASVSGIYYCPHLPEAGCACRKPKIALIRRAVRKLNINLRASFMIGDQYRDVQMARNAKTNGILVLTGAGRSHRVRAQAEGFLVVSHLRSALRWILKNEK